MRPVFDTLGSLIKEFNEEQLVKAIPIFSRIVAELIEDIRKTNDFESAEVSFDLLLVISGSLAKLSYMHSHELPSDLTEVLKIEGYLYPGQNGTYKESREPIYKAIKNGEILV